MGLSMMLAASTAAPVWAVNSANGDINPGDNTSKNYTYSAPTKPMAVDGNVVTASAHRAAAPLLGLLGVNATSGFGMINGGAPTDLASAQECPAMGIWGSSLNSNPDPYYWNYFYNFYAKENSLETIADSVDGGEALRNDNVAASPGQADGTLLPEYGNVSVSLASRPEVLIGVAKKGAAANDISGYDEQLQTIRSFVERDSEGNLKIYKESELPEGYVLYSTDSSKYSYKEGLSFKKTGDDSYIQILSSYYKDGDETYQPKLVSYEMTTIADMIRSVKNAADAVSEVEQAAGKKTRYDKVETIASDYESYIYGIISYVQAQLAQKGLSQKTFAFVTAVNDDGTFTLGGADYNSATSLGRAYEYCISAATPLTKETKTVTKDQLLKADVIITLNNSNITADKMADAGVDSETYKGILITNNPASLYGITMNSVENAIGYAYVIGSMYADELDIDPVELSAYFYQHFEHITDIDSLATVVTTNFSAVNLPEGVSADISDYSAIKVENMLETGMNYYTKHETDFDAAAFKDSGIDQWTPDYTQGIGKDSVIYGTPVFTWSKDGKSATALFKQTNGDKKAEKTVKATITSKVTKAATYTKKGETTYTATVKDPSTGEVYTAKKTIADIPVKTKTNISKTTVKLSKTAYTYNGKSQKPSVSVRYGSKKLKANTDYTVTYSANKNIGTAKAVIKGKGDYTGRVTKTFRINPKASAITNTKNSKKASAKITWKKVSGVTSYQLRYRTGKAGWKTVTAKGSTKTAKTITGLKKNKTYSFQIRTCKKSGKANYYSGWSKVKTCKINK